MNEKADLLSVLLRELEIEVGIRDVDISILSALIDAVKALKVHGVDDFCKQFAELHTIFTSTEPKFGILTYHFAVLSQILVDLKKDDKDLSVKKWKTLVINKIKSLIKEAKLEAKSIIKYSEKINVDGKTILLHDHSRTVQDVLVHYKSIGKRFHVIIAEQDFEKTHSNIERLHKAQIPFQVVPSYMLSHLHDNIDMAFFGAVTLKNTMDFVMAPGTHGIVSEFHVVNVPIYVFMSTLKFSLWKSKKRGEVFIHKHKRLHYSKPIEYERIKYSHDRVPANLFTKIITDEGVLSPKELEELFSHRMKDYEKLSKLSRRY